MSLLGINLNVPFQCSRFEKAGVVLAAIVGLVGLLAIAEGALAMHSDHLPFLSKIHDFHDISAAELGTRLVIGGIGISALGGGFLSGFIRQKVKYLKEHNQMPQTLVGDAAAVTNEYLGEEETINKPGDQKVRYHREKVIKSSDYRSTSKRRVNTQFSKKEG